MQQRILGRFLVVVGVVVVALYYIFPSARMLHYRLTVKPPEASNKAAVDAYTSKTRQMESFSLPFGAHPLRFGLDLQGGTDITIELDEKATLRDHLASLKREISRKFRSEPIGATIVEHPEDRTLTIQLSRVEDARVANLILKDYKKVFAAWNEADFENSGKVILRLRSDHVTRIKNDAIDAAWKVIRNRVDALGLTQPVVVKQGTDRIRVQMPGVSDPQSVVKNIIKPAQLEFRIVHDNEEQELAKLFSPEAYKQVCDYIAKHRTLPDPLPLKEGQEIPVGYTLRPGEYSDSSGVKAGQPVKVRYKPYLVRDNVELTGDGLKAVWAYNNPTNLASPWEIHFEFDRQGAIDLRDVTTQNLKKFMAIILDNYVFSAPRIKSVIPRGRGLIEGNFTQKEAVDLSLVLKAGALPANLVPVDQYVVEATLGADSIRKGVSSLLIGGVVVIIFMIGYYGTSGGIAVIALVINVLCVIAVLALSGATLTLSGIGGILLTIGMAVDANVLIYERIREEKATSRGLKAAIAKGFGRAFSVIFDSNLTTLITALVLLQFGTGSVQGFALTMTFGIFATLFTGLFVTHVLTDFWVSRRNKLGIGRFRVFRDPKINFIRLRVIAYFISGALLLVGFGNMILHGGPQFGVEFTGGVMAHATFKRQTSEDEIKSALAKYFPTPIVQRIQGTQEFIVRVRSEGANPGETENLMEKALTARYGAGNALLQDVRGVSDEVGGEFIQKAIIAVFIASLGVLIYLWFRFELVFGAGAVVALFHDVMITVGMLTLFNQEITLNVVAALLIVVGYSVNDTIVIFDRIRETIRTTYGMAYPDMLNQSINQSLNRTTITSLSTLFTTLVMLVLGGPGLHGFAMVLTIGIIIGTYSSSFVATPVLYEVHEYRRRRQGQAVPERAARAKAR